MSDSKKNSSQRLPGFIRKHLQSTPITVSPLRQLIQDGDSSNTNWQQQPDAISTPIRPKPKSATDDLAGWMSSLKQRAINALKKDDELAEATQEEVEFQKLQLSTLESGDDELDSPENSEAFERLGSILYTHGEGSKNRSRSRLQDLTNDLTNTTKDQSDEFNTAMENTHNSGGDGVEEDGTINNTIGAPPPQVYSAIADSAESDNRTLLFRNANDGSPIPPAASENKGIFGQNLFMNVLRSQHPDLSSRVFDSSLPSTSDMDVYGTPQGELSNDDDVKDDFKDPDGENLQQDVSTVNRDDDASSQAGSVDDTQQPQDEEVIELLSSDDDDQQSCEDNLETEESEDEDEDDGEYGYDDYGDDELEVNLSRIHNQAEVDMSEYDGHENASTTRRSYLDETNRDAHIHNYDHQDDYGEPSEIDDDIVVDDENDNEDESKSKSQDGEYLDVYSDGQSIVDGDSNQGTTVAEGTQEDRDEQQMQLDEGIDPVLNESFTDEFVNRYREESDNNSSSDGDSLALHYNENTPNRSRVLNRSPVNLIPGHVRSSLLRDVSSVKTDKAVESVRSSDNTTEVEEAPSLCDAGLVIPAVVQTSSGVDIAQYMPTLELQKIGSVKDVNPFNQSADEQTLEKYQKMVEIASMRASKFDINFGFGYTSQQNVSDETGQDEQMSEDTSDQQQDVDDRADDHAVSAAAEAKTVKKAVDEKKPVTTYNFQLDAEQVANLAESALAALGESEIFQGLRSRVQSPEPPKVLSIPCSPQVEEAPSIIDGLIGSEADVSVYSGIGDSIITVSESTVLKDDTDGVFEFVKLGSQSPVFTAQILSPSPVPEERFDPVVHEDQQPVLEHKEDLPAVGKSSPTASKQSTPKSPRRKRRATDFAENVSPESKRKRSARQDAKVLSLNDDDNSKRGEISAPVHEVHPMTLRGSRTRASLKRAVDEEQTLDTVLDEAKPKPEIPSSKSRSKRATNSPTQITSPEQKPVKYKSSKKKSPKRNPDSNHKPMLAVPESPTRIRRSSRLRRNSNEDTQDPVDTEVLAPATVIEHTAEEEKLLVNAAKSLGKGKAKKSVKSTKTVGKPVVGVTENSQPLAPQKKGAISSSAKASESKVQKSSLTPRRRSNRINLNKK